MNNALNVAVMGATKQLPHEGLDDLGRNQAID